MTVWVKLKLNCSVKSSSYDCKSYHKLLQSYTPLSYHWIIGPLEPGPFYMWGVVKKNQSQLVLKLEIVFTVNDFLLKTKSNLAALLFFF